MPQRLLLKLRGGGSLDDDSAQARSSERSRRIALSIVAATLARGTNILVLLATIPLTLGYLGAEKFGMWATLSALSGLLAVTDFGVSNSLVSAVARRARSGQQQRLRQLISTGYVLIGLFTVALAILGVALVSFVDWPQLFNVSSKSAKEQASSAAAVFLAAMILANPAGLVYRLQQGLQEGYRAGIWQAAASIATLGGVLVAIWLGASLSWLIAALVGTPLLLALANTLHYFGWVRPDLRPGLGFVRRRLIGSLGATGSSFLVLQLSVAIWLQANNIIVAQMLGAAAVAVYSVPERMFSLITVVVTVLIIPFWPAFGDAFRRGDRQWIVATFRRKFRIMMAGTTAASLALLFAGPWLVGKWVGGAVDPPLALFVGLALWKVLETAGNVASMLLNAMGRIKVQAIAGALTATCGLGLSVLFTAKYGVAGVVFGTVTAYATCFLPIIAVAVMRELRRLKEA